MRDWRRMVYGKVVYMTRAEWAEWNDTRDAVLTRDKYTCRRCDKRADNGRGLSVHHIIPRSEGGANGMHNLVTLCHKCHDFVELSDMRTMAEIVNSYDGDIKPASKSEEVTGIREETFTRPAWHKYVYGGVKR